MISSLYNREDSVNPGHCVATANEPNTICPSANALGEDEFGCVPWTAIGSHTVYVRNGTPGDVKQECHLPKRDTREDLCKINS